MNTANDENLVQRLKTLMDRTGLTYSELAPAMRLAPATLRFVLQTGRLPLRNGPRANFTTFIDRNGAALRRDEVHFI